MSILGDLQKVRAPLAGALTGSGSWTSGALGPVTVATSTATTSITVTGATAGDYVLLGSSTSTENVRIGGYVSGTNAVTVSAENLLTSNQTPATTTIYAIVLPRASFVAPSALGTATTSTP